MRGSRCHSPSFRIARNTISAGTPFVESRRGFLPSVDTTLFNHPHQPHDNTRLDPLAIHSLGCRSTCIDTTQFIYPHQPPESARLGPLVIHSLAADGPAGVKVRSLRSAWEGACPVTNLAISSRTHQPRVLAAISSADRSTLWTSLSANCSSSKLASVVTVKQQKAGLETRPPLSQHRERLYSSWSQLLVRGERTDPSVLRPKIFSEFFPTQALQSTRLRVALFSSFPLLV